MTKLDGPINLTETCSKCGKLERPAKLQPDRHHKHYCLGCSIRIRLCDICGSTMLDDNSVDGQLHYDDWCFK